MTLRRFFLSTLARRETIFSGLLVAVWLMGVFYGLEVQNSNNSFLMGFGTVCIGVAMTVTSWIIRSRWNKIRGRYWLNDASGKYEDYAVKHNILYEYILTYSDASGPNRIGFIDEEDLFRVKLGA